MPSVLGERGVEEGGEPAQARLETARVAQVELQRTGARAPQRRAHTVCLPGRLDQPDARGGGGNLRTAPADREGGNQRVACSEVRAEPARRAGAS